MRAEGDEDTLLLEKMKAKLTNLEEPKVPPCKRYSTNDATTPKMHELLNQNERGLLLFRDELIGLLESWEKEGNEGDRSFYLEAWNGYGSRTTDRIGRGTIHTKNLCVSILGSTQPSKLLSYFGRTLEGGDNDGLLQRFQLLIYPDGSPLWSLVDRMPRIPAQLQATAISSALAEMDFYRYGAKEEASGVPYFRFAPEAQEVFYTWLTRLEQRLRQGTEDPLMTEHLAKYRKLLPSLALIFHLIDLANGGVPGPVTSMSLERAIQWCTYLESHARRIYETSLTSAYQSARYLAKKIQEGDVPLVFDLRDLYRKGWSLLKTKETAESACTILIQSSWLKEETLSAGGKKITRYVVNPQVLCRNNECK